MEQYIKKSTLVAEIEKKIMQYEVAFNNPSFASYEASLIAKGKYRKLLDIRQFLDTLEVKEVNLKKEIDDVWKKDFSGHFDVIGYTDFIELAKYFFKLGLKAQKGEET